MKFYHFGAENLPAIFLFPGTCCHWKAVFEGVIPLLTPFFHVVCVSYNGFDETEQTVFESMEKETEQIERYIKEKFGGRIFAAYGCSLGGSFVGLLIQRGNVHIDHGILGSSDLDQEEGVMARLEAKIIGRVLYGVFQKGRLPGMMEKRLRKKPEEERAYCDKMLAMFGANNGRMKFVRRESMENQFYSDLVTPLKEDICAPGTKVHCFYAVKMGEKYEKRYMKHFASPDIRRHDMRHEELLICYPLRWAEEVKSCCGIGGTDETGKREANR